MIDVINGPDRAGGPRAALGTILGVFGVVALLILASTGAIPSGLRAPRTPRSGAGGFEGPAPWVEPTARSWGCGSNLSFSIHATPSTGPAPLAVNFSSQFSGGCPPVSVAWEFGDEGEAQGANVTHVFDGAGNFSVLARAQDSMGQNASAQLRIVVTGGSGPVSVQVHLRPSVGSAPLFVTGWANVTGGNLSDDLGIGWSFGDGGSGRGDPVTHWYSAPGTYTVTATAEQDDRTIGSATATVQVTQGTTPSGANLTVRAYPTSGSAPLRVTVDAYSYGAELDTTLSLCFGDGSPCPSWYEPSVPSPPTASHLYVANGTYTITGTLVAPDGSVLAGATASVIVTPASPIVAAPTESRTGGPAPLTVEFSVAVSGGSPPYALQWGFGDGTQGSAVEGSPTTHRYDRSGTFFPTLELADGAGHTWNGSLAPVTVGAPPTPAGLPPALLGAPTAGLLALMLAGVLASGFVLSRFSIRRRASLRRDGEELVREMEQEK